MFSGTWNELHFHSPGVHVLRLSCGGRVLGERKLLERVKGGGRG